MLFTSTSFVVLVLATLAVFYLPALRRWQTATLVLSSFVFDTFKARDEADFFGTKLLNRRQHLASTTLFISFFPHLVAGPILKAHDFYPQIKPKAFRDVDWEFCFRKLVVGYFLKMVVA